MTISHTLARSFALIPSLSLLCAHAQTPAKPATYTGCVTEIPSAPGMYVLATPGRCYLLEAPNATRLVNHNVVLTGALSEAEGMTPDTIHLQSTTAIKDACSQTCTLPAPGTRNPHGRERPGHEGATPGLKPDPPTPPPAR